MHELYIAECIAKQSLAAVPQHLKNNDVSEIVVRIGELDAVVTETLTFMFDAIKSEYGLNIACLRVQSESVRCKCKSCDADFSLSEPVFICPHCRSMHVMVTQGRGITLMEMSIKEVEHTNENTDH